MKLHEYLNPDKLAQYVAERLIGVRNHPTLPIRIYNYTAEAQFSQSWPHEVCACRGLIVDSEDNIISRPMYKFFNLGQNSTIMNKLNYREGYGSMEHVVDSAFLMSLVQFTGNPLTITRKMDGMMGVRWAYDGQEGIATRGSFESDGAVFATEKWQKFVKYGASRDFIPEGWTPIFEIIAKHLRIVIPYEWDGLCLLTMVNNETGEEMSYDQLKEVWTNLNSYSKTIDADGNSVPGKPWCRLVEKFDISLEQAKDDQSKEEEGYVVSVNRRALHPVKAKVKLAEYLRLHKLLTQVNPQAIWKELALPMSPWIDNTCQYDFINKCNVTSIPVPQEFRAWVQGWQNGLTAAFHAKLVLAITAVGEMTGRDYPLAENVPFKNDQQRKQWLVDVQGYTKEVAGYAMQLYRGKITEAYEAIWNSVRPFGKDETFYVEGQGE